MNDLISFKLDFQEKIQQEDQSFIFDEDECCDFLAWLDDCFEDSYQQEYDEEDYEFFWDMIPGRI